MLRNHNDEVLRQKGIKTEIVPFYQMWQELVNEKTLDIYQYRILTTLSALEELAEVLRKTISGLFTNDANIESCREETLFILNKDPLMEKYFKSLANRLKFSIGQKPKSDAEKTRLYALIKYAVTEIKQNYARYAVNELKASICQGNMKEIARYANIVASQAAHNGWSSQALDELLRFFRNDKTFDEQWALFEETILETEQIEHDVLIHIPFRNQRKGNELSTFEILGNLELETHTYAELIEDYADISDIKNMLNSEKRYFRVKVRAFDVYTAAHKAVKKISDLLNMASFYNLVSVWDLSSVSFVAINNVNKYHKAFNADRLYRTYDYLDSSGKIFEYTKNIFVNDEQVVLREKLTGAFGYANISRASLFQEEKYMNLWVALESLARTRLYPDIISNVRRTVPAAMSLRYIYRVVRNYVEDCSRCQVKFDFPQHNINIDMKQDTKQKMVTETIQLFRTPELYSILLQKCKVNSLLAYRTESLYEMLTQMDTLEEKIENHHNRVEWQIQRLYRIRNEIVHSALQNETSLILYIEHLYDYLATYITEIVTCMSDRKDRTLEETLAVIQGNYDVFIDFMKKKEYPYISESVVKSGVINLL